MTFDEAVETVLLDALVAGCRHGSGSVRAPQEVIEVNLLEDGVPNAQVAALDGPADVERRVEALSRDGVPLRVVLASPTELTLGGAFAWRQGSSATANG